MASQSTYFTLTSRQNGSPDAEGVWFPYNLIYSQTFAAFDSPFIAYIKAENPVALTVSRTSLMELFSFICFKREILFGKASESGHQLTSSMSVSFFHIIFDEKLNFFRGLWTIWVMIFLKKQINYIMKINKGALIVMKREKGEKLIHFNWKDKFR